MPREANIPLFLWIATAVVAHGLWGGGADKAARLIGETLEIRDFAASVRRHAKGVGKPIEVSFVENNDPEEERPDPQAEKDDEAEAEPPAEDESDLKDEPDPKHRKPDPKAKDDAPKPEEKKEEEKKAEEKKEEEKPKAELKIEKLPDPEKLRRIAVKQHADPNQEDNPNAEFIADQANKVKEQTQASITSTDQDDAKPAPGTSMASGPSDRPGSGEIDKVAQSDEHEGDPNRAPQEKEQKNETARPAEAKAQSPERMAALAGVARRQDGAAHGSPSSENSSKLPGQAGQRAQLAAREQEAMPDTLSSDSGRFTVPGPREASIEQKARRARKKRELPKLRSGNSSDLLGLGAPGATPGGINLNLTPSTAAAAIGRDRLSRERLADGQRRLSQHRGTWKTGGIERWRHAIENYVPNVKPGNQTALNSARVPFASYLNAVHNRLHPLFADNFLASLEELPASHPMNQPNLVTHLEIVLDADEGRVKDMGVIKTSGVTAFDISALESLQKAQPFGTPPREIVSPDGNVYFHWEFYRNPQYACSTYFAYPYILKTAPKQAPPPNVPNQQQPPAEDYQPPAAGERHGEVRPEAPAPGPG